MGDSRPATVRRGLTLIESIVASAILAVAITAVFSAVASGRAHAEVAADELATTVAAEDLLARHKLKCLTGWPSAIHLIFVAT